MTILGAVTRKAITVPVTSRAVVQSQARLGGRRFMGDGPDHPTFTPPYNPWVIRGILGFVLFGGSGSMVYGMVHQQYKQGYWKKK